MLDAIRPDSTARREQRQEKRYRYRLSSLRVSDLWREKTMSTRERKQRRLFDVPVELHKYLIPCAVIH